MYYVAERAALAARMATVSSPLLCTATLSGICPNFRGVAPASTSCVRKARLADLCNGVVIARGVLGRPALLRCSPSPSPGSFLRVEPERPAHSGCGRRNVGLRVHAVRPALSDNAHQPKRTETAARDAAKDLLPGASSPATGLGNLEAPLKECTICQRLKFPVDFEKTVSTADKRTEACRACLAAYRAGRLGRPLHHLSLSLDEAWDKGKSCARCGHFKEIRDYARNMRKADGLNIYCRACASQKWDAEPTFPPADVPQQCDTCGQVKAASEYFANSKKRSGLANICKMCSVKRVGNYRKKLGESPSLPREEKICSGCGENKKVAEFSKNPGTLDGFDNVCKKCALARVAARKLNSED